MFKRSNPTCSQLILGTSVAIVVGFVVLLIPFRQATLEVDLASGTYHHSGRTWWGLVPSRSVSQTWVSEHASPSSREPVIGMVSGHCESLFSNGYRKSGSYRFARMDIGELIRADELGIVPDDIRTPVADAVIRQWLRIKDDRWGKEAGRDSIAVSVGYLAMNGVELTPELLVRLEAGETWMDILHPG